MSPSRLGHLLSLVGQQLQRDPTRRCVVSPGERLMITLRYICTGDSMLSQSFNFRVGLSTISGIIAGTCEILWKVLCPVYVRTPSSAKEWKRISEKYLEKWNFPHCIGALDGKHVAIERPRNAGSLFYNYKQFHSIVLMALVDADLTVIMVDIGEYGRDNDAAIFSHCEMGQRFSNGSLHVPPSELFGNMMLPYVIVADGIFALKPWLIKPFSGRNLSEAEYLTKYLITGFLVLGTQWRTASE